MKKRATRQIVFYASLVAIWIIVARLKIWPPYILPDPKSVWDSLAAGFRDHSFWIAIEVSMRRIAIGYGISVALGVLLGLLIASSKFLEETVGGLLVSQMLTLYTTPIIYLYLDRFRLWAQERWGSRRRLLRGRAPEPGE